MANGPLDFTRAIFSYDELCRVAKNLRSKKDGVEISDRRYFLTVYPKCFVASEAIRWMEKNLGFSKEQAIFFGQLMTTRELIHHYLDRNQKFGDTGDFWRFQYHEDGPLNWKHIWVWDVESKACQIVERLYRMLLQICKKALEKETIPEYGVKSAIKGLADFTVINIVNYYNVLGRIVHTREFEEFEYAVAELQKVQLNMDNQEKLAFWLNVYNLLALHAVIISANKNENPFESYFSRNRYFTTHTYIIANMTFCLDDIEHGILRAKSGRFNEGDDRVLHKLDSLEPRIFSVLSCCNKSAPRPLIIKHTNVDRYLHYSCKCHFSTVKFQEYTMFIPKVCDWYRDDYGTKDDLIKFIQTYLRYEQNQILSSYIKSNKLNIKFIEYDWELYLELKDFDLEPDDPLMKDI